MAKHTVTLIPGDGIGLETTAAMRRVVEALASISNGKLLKRVLT